MLLKHQLILILEIIFSSLCKTLLMNKYKNKGIGLNAISSYKRASNILDKAERITGRPDAVLFRKDEENTS